MCVRVYSRMCVCVCVCVGGWVGARFFYMYMHVCLNACVRTVWDRNKKVEEDCCRLRAFLRHFVPRLARRPLAAICPRALALLCVDACMCVRVCTIMTCCIRRRALALHNICSQYVSKTKSSMCVLYSCESMSKYVSLEQITDQ